MWNAIDRKMDAFMAVFRKATTLPKKPRPTKRRAK